MDLSIIIVNWNSVRFLRQCLESVYSHGGGLRYEILVVDNASYDGSAELVATEFPAVRFIQSDENLGFARANNLAAKLATGRYLLFLNSDTQIVGPALQRLVACIDAMPDAGAVGPKLLNSDGSIQESCLQAFPSIVNHFLDARWLRAMFPRWKLWGNRVLFADGSRPAPVDGIVGASMMVSRELFEELGGFCPRYFMYAEDMDLCYRLKMRGRVNYYVAAATVVHHGGQSSKLHSDTYFAAVAMRESLLNFMRIHRGEFYAWLFLCSTVIAAICRLSILSIAMLLPIPAERQHALSRAAAKWRRIFRWATGFDPVIKQLA